jgi:hypothetical protein
VSSTNRAKCGQVISSNALTLKLAIVVPMGLKDAVRESLVSDIYSYSRDKFHASSIVRVRGIAAMGALIRLLGRTPPNVISLLPLPASY